MQINSRYSASRGGGLETLDVLLTEQHHAARLNPNRIVAKAKLTGMLPMVQKIGCYGDFTGISTYQQAQDQINTARELFMGLPARIRDRFDNDPAHLLDFLSKENNREEAIKLGLIEAKKETQSPETGVEDKPAAEPAK